MLKIAISGKMGSGKTTLYEALAKFHNRNHYMRYGTEEDVVHRFSLADPVKEIAINYFGMPVNKKDRKLLQQIGQKFRSIEENVWVRLMIEKVEYQELEQELWTTQSRLWEAGICDDVRFPNEVEALKESGWIMIRLNVSEEEQKRRLKCAYGEGWKVHWKNRNEISETALDNYDFDWDYVFDDLDMKDIPQKVKEIYAPFKI